MMPGSALWRCQFVDRRWVDHVMQFLNIALPEAPDGGEIG